MQKYWNNRFATEGQIWGSEPSKTAYIALELFQENDVKSVFIPGAGYGRNSRLFSQSGLETAGIEISDVAYEIAQVFDPESDIKLGSVFDLPLIMDRYDSLFCFNVLHLFCELDREKIVQMCNNLLNPGGYLFFTVFSDEEESFGIGNELEPGTFESKPGRPIHYFTAEELHELFRDYEILEIGRVEESENHGHQGKHIHKLRYIMLHKKSC